MITVILKTVFGMLLLILLGALCGRLNIIDGATQKKLSALLVQVVQPAFLLMAFQQTFSNAMLSSYFLCLAMAVLAFALMVLVPRVLFKKGTLDRETLLLISTFPNVGFFGVPVMQSMFGDVGVFYLSTMIMVFNLLMWTYGVVVASGQKLQVKTAAKQLISPALISVLLGLLFFCLCFTIPELLATPLSMVGNMVTPLSMLLVGVAVSRSNLREGLKSPRVYGICLLRTVVLPVLVALVLCRLPADAMLKIIVTLSSGFPCASLALVLCVQYDRNSALAGECAALTALLCILTTPLLYLLLTFLIAL